MPIARVIVVLSCCTPIALGQDPEPAPLFRPERLLVRFKPGVSQATKDTLHTAVGATELNRFGLVDGLTLVKVSPASLAQARRGYQNSADVLYVEPDVRITLFGTFPDDCNFHKQWALHNIGQDIDGITGVPDVDIDALPGETLTHRRMASGAV